MPPRHLSDAARCFLDGHVSSVMQLELVLLLQRDPGEGWTVARAVRELRCSEAWAVGQLADLAERGVAAVTGDVDLIYRLDAHGPLAGAIDQIAQRYPQWRTSIIAMIFSPPSSDD